MPSLLFQEKTGIVHLLLEATFSPTEPHTISPAAESASARAVLPPEPPAAAQKDSKKIAPPVKAEELTQRSMSMSMGSMSKFAKPVRCVRRGVLTCEA